MVGFPAKKSRRNKTHIRIKEFLKDVNKQAAYGDFRARAVHGRPCGRQGKTVWRQKAANASKRACRFLVLNSHIVCHEPALCFAALEQKDSADQPILLFERQSFKFTAIKPCALFCISPLHFAVKGKGFTVREQLYIVYEEKIIGLVELHAADMSASAADIQQFAGDAVRSGTRLYAAPHGRLAVNMRDFSVNGNLLPEKVAVILYVLSGELINFPKLIRAAANPPAANKGL